MRTAVAVLALVLNIKGAAFAQNAEIVSEPIKPKAVSCRERLETAEKNLRIANDEHVECMRQLVEKTEEDALRRTALSNADNARLRTEGQLAGVRENNEVLVKDNENLREKNKSMEFTLARYSWAFAVTTAFQLAGMIGVGYLIVRMRRKKPQA